MHNNLFAYGADRREVYDALQRDMKRDRRNIGFMDLIFGIALFYLLVQHLRGWELLAALVVGFVGLQRLNYFIDQSNRNFHMHLLDWLDAEASSDENRRA